MSSSVQFSHSVISNSLRLHGSQHTRPLCPRPTPRVYPNSCPLRDIKKRRQEYTELYKKDPHDPDNHNGVITNLQPDILDCEVKWALESITTNKASGGDGIPAELFQILKDDAVKVLHSICKQMWKTQQWPQDWKRSVFIPIPKKGNAKECSRSEEHTSELQSQQEMCFL